MSDYEIDCFMLRRNIELLKEIEGKC